MAADPPLHPSYEDRAGRARPRLRVARRRRVRAPGGALGAGARSRPARPTPTSCTCTTSRRCTRPRARVAPGVPVVGHLHGTELLMLEAIEARAATAGRTREAWAERMRDWAAALRAADRALATRRSSAPSSCSASTRTAACVVPNGFDPELFRPAPRRPPGATGAGTSSTSRSGWPPGERAGLGPLRGGRPRGLRRRPRRDAGAALRRPLHRGQADRAADRGLRRAPGQASPRRAPLVLVGGFPGEWEGEHPLDTIRRTGAERRLPRRLARRTTSCRTSSPPPTSSCCRRCASSSARCSSRAMACGAAADRRRRVRPGRDRRATARRAGSSSPTTAIALADALVEAVNRAVERRRRGERRGRRRPRALRLARARGARSPRSTTSRAASSPRSCSPAPDPRRFAGTGCGPATRRRCAGSAGPARSA